MTKFGSRGGSLPDGFGRVIEALKSRDCMAICPSPMGVALAMAGWPSEKIMLFEGNLSMRLLDLGPDRFRRKTALKTH